MIHFCVLSVCPGAGHSKCDIKVCWMNGQWVEGEMETSPLPFQHT